jgi:hypothetical protein
VVLGPFEAYCAELMWFREIVSAADLPRDFGPQHDQPLQVPSVAWQMQRRILETALIYGQLDTTAAGPRVVSYIDAAMFKNGMRLDPETWATDLAHRWNSSPFQRSREIEMTTEGRFFLRMDAPHPSGVAAAKDASEVPSAVVVAVERYLRRVGYQMIDGVDVRAYSQRLTAMPWPPVAGMDNLNAALLTGSVRSVAAAMGIFHAIERSVEQEVPFFSRDALAPAWIHVDATAPEFEVIRAVLEIPDGPTLPATLSAVADSAVDPRVLRLRQFIKWASERILTFDSSAIQEVQREGERALLYGQRGIAASRIARVVTYLSVPIGTAEAISGVVGPGLVLTYLGALGEAASAVIKRFSRRHWISL